MQHDQSTTVGGSVPEHDQDVTQVPQSAAKVPVVSSVSNELLHKSLSELKIINQDVLDILLKESNLELLDLGEMLYKKDLIDEVTLGKIIADLIGMTYVNL